MGQLNIRDFPEELIRKAKMFGFERGLTLREFVIMAVRESCGSRNPGQVETRGGERSARKSEQHADSPLGPDKVPTDPKPAKKSRFPKLPVMGEK